MGEIHKQIAIQTRNKYQQKKSNLHIQYVDMFPKIEVHPIIFEQVYSKEAKDKFEENMVKIWLFFALLYKETQKLKIVINFNNKFKLLLDRC